MKSLLASPLIRILLALNLLVIVLVAGRSLAARSHAEQTRAHEKQRTFVRAESAGMMRADDMARVFRILNTSSKTQAFSDADVGFLVDQLDRRAPNATELGDTSRRVLVLYALGSVGDNLTTDQRSLITPALKRLLVCGPGSDRVVVSTTVRLVARLGETSLVPSLRDVRSSGDPALKSAAEVSLKKLGVP